MHQEHMKNQTAGTLETKFSTGLDCIHVTVFSKTSHFQFFSENRADYAASSNVTAYNSLPHFQSCSFLFHVYVELDLTTD